MRTTLLVASALLFACNGASDKDKPHPQPGPTAPAAQDASLTCSGGETLSAYLADDKLCLVVYAHGLGAARQLAFAKNGDLFVNHGKVSVLWDADRDGDSDDDERAVFAQAPNLNHGLAFDRAQKFLYASSDTTVYRWPYRPGQREAKKAAEVVIHDIPGGGHSTRTLAFDSQGRLYMTIGSVSNVDTSQEEWNTRSQIRRYAVGQLPSGGLDFSAGKPIATGMRNEVGLYIDPQDRLWGVENGRDSLSEDALGGDIHNDNPGEEINLVDGQGASFYGYPLCFSEYKLASGQGAGTQWADHSLPAALRKDDAFCRDPSQVHPPLAVMPAHWAPLGVLQYSGTLLPYAGDLLIAAHGSWNRQPPSGRVIARAKLAGSKVVSIDAIAGEKTGKGGLAQGTWSVRPVDVQQGPDGAVYFSDDMGGRVLRLGYRR
jgi:glucose/arabinose dehydrogenase